MYIRRGGGSFMLGEAVLTHIMRRATRSFTGRGTGSPRVSHPLITSGSRLPDMLYIHVPFCRELCPFCSFHRIRFFEASATAYFDALQKDLDFHLSLGAGYRSVYIGGGTPTILPKRLTELIASLYARWPIESVSVESNPDILETDSVENLVNAGVHRLSVGVQSFDDNLLKSMNRLEKYGSGDSIVERINKLSGAIPETFNIDLLFNLPGQTDASIKRDAEIVGKLPISQVTWYPLMSSTPQAKRRTSKEERQYHLINRLLEDGFMPSSAWCFSRGDALTDEYIIDSHEYAAAGSGAFGYLNGTIYGNTFSIPDYCESLNTNGVSDLALVHRFNPIERRLYSLLLTCFSGRISMYDTKLLHRIARRIALVTRLAQRATPSQSADPGDAILSVKSRYATLVLMREFFTGVNALRRGCIGGNNN